MNRTKTVLIANFLILTGPLWAGCGGDGGGYYKGDTGYYSSASSGGCAGSLSCDKPITRMSCSDQYCFYPPEETMSQARCCRDFGNIGNINTPGYTGHFDD